MINNIKNILFQLFFIVSKATLTSVEINDVIKVCTMFLPAVVRLS